MKLFRQAILLLICLWQVSLYAQHNSSEFTILRNAINTLKQDPDLRNAGVGVYIKDLSTGKVVGQLNADLVLKPASTMKVVTTAAALEVLGEEYRFLTKIEYDGILDTAEHILRGNLYITGGADPTLGSKYFKTTKSHQFLLAWATAIKQAGIDSITGYIIGDASKYSLQTIPPTWSWEDLGNYFGAGPSGLTIYDNSYTLFFNTGSRSGAPTKITRMTPDIPEMTFTNQVVSANVRSDRSYIFGIPYSYERVISGRLPLSRTDYKVRGALPDPALLAAKELEQELIKHGTKTKKGASTMRILEKTGNTSKKRTTIYTTKSPTLTNIIYSLNHRSINLFAEHLLVETGYKKSAVNDVKSATNTIENFWASKGMDIQGFSMNDGSGLSHYNHISAKQLVFILEYMTHSKHYESFYKSLPISGESGTLRRVCQNTVARGKIHAKSGSIRDVRCYAGYATTISGRQMVFALMINNYNGSSSTARRKLERIMTAIVQE